MKPRSTWCGAVSAIALSVLLLLALPAGAREEGRKLRGHDGLAFVIHLPEGPVGPNQPVPMRMELVNVGEVPLLVDTALLPGRTLGCGDLEVRMLGPDGRARELEARLGGTFTGTWTRLEPGARAEATWDLQASHDVDAVGLYRVQAIYANDRDPPEAQEGTRVWKGTLASRVRRFRRRGEVDR